MRKFKHIPTGEVWYQDGNRETIMPTHKKSVYGMPLWITVNSKDWEEMVPSVDAYTIEKLGYKKEILSVKRTKDNQIFSIGNHIHVHFYHQRNGKPHLISKILVTDNGIVLHINNGNCDCKCTVRLRNAIKMKEEPLFTTEDGVEIFEGDTIFSVEHTYYKIDDKIAGIYKGSNKNHPVEHWYNDDKYFSTKEAAEEYILLNKPVLSINDFYSFSLCQAEEENTHNKLKALVKSRL